MNDVESIAADAWRNVKVEYLTETVRRVPQSRYQLGLDRQAGSEIVPASEATAVGAWAANRTVLSVSERSWAKCSRTPISVSLRNPSASGRNSELIGGASTVCPSDAADSPASGAKAATKTSADTLSSRPTSVMTAPPYECPTRTTGPSARARARRSVARQAVRIGPFTASRSSRTSSCSVRNRALLQSGLGAIQTHGLVRFWRVTVWSEIDVPACLNGQSARQTTSSRVPSRQIRTHRYFRQEVAILDRSNRHGVGISVGGQRRRMT